MVYGNGMIGVTEANYAVVFLHLLTWAMRPQRWLAHPFARLAGSSLAQQLPRPVTAFLAALKVGRGAGPGAWAHVAAPSAGTAPVLVCGSVPCTTPTRVRAYVARSIAARLP